MARPEKLAKVDEILDKLRKTQGLILTDFRGLSVSDMRDLRNRLRKQQVEYKVLKNTLLRRAVDKADMPGLLQYLDGPTAVAFEYDDAISPATTLSDFARLHKGFEIKAGVIEGEILDGAGVRRIATLPPREVLLSMLVGSLQAPMANLVGAMSGPARALAMTLRQIADQKATG